MSADQGESSAGPRPDQLSPGQSGSRAWAAPDATRVVADGEDPRSAPANGVAPLELRGTSGGGLADRLTSRWGNALPLRPLSVAEILDGTFGTIRRNPRATIGVAAVLVSVEQMLVVLVQLITEGIPTVSGFASGGLSFEFVSGLDTLVAFVLSAVIGAILTGIIVVVVADDVLGRAPPLRDVWLRVRPRLWALLAASLIAGILPFVGLLLVIAPGVILWGAWALTTPALVLERLGPFTALRRSWRLVWPDFGRVWGVRALSVILGWVIAGLVVLPLQALGIIIAQLRGDLDSTGSAIVLVLVVIGSILGGMVAEPFLAGVLALLYIDRRMRAEGLDIVLQLQSRSERRAPSTPAPGPHAGLPTGESTESTIGARP
jgi:hypothetical protein